MNKTGTVTLETNRLTLRRFTPADAQDMFDNWASDPTVTRFLTWPAHPSVEVTGRVIADWVKAYENGEYFNWAIALKDSGRVIGNIAVVNLNESADAAEIGYCLGRAYWNRGIMTEALKVVTCYLFDTVGLNRVAACHDANNPASGRVMEKAGMKTEGILRQSQRNNSGICDAVWHSIVRSDIEKQ